MLHEMKKIKRARTTLYAFFLLTLIISFNSDARVAEVPGNRFFSCVNKVPVVVALFFRNTNRAAYDQYRLLKKRMEAVSNNETYKYARVLFIGCNLCSDASLARNPDLAITTTPVVMLFKNGIPVGSVRAPVTLTGCFTEVQLSRFINAHIGDTIKSIAQQQQEYEKELVKSGLAYGYYGYGLRPYYCWPHYGYGYGYGGYGFGFGYCGPWHW